MQQKLKYLANRVIENGTIPIHRKDFYQHYDKV